MEPTLQVNVRSLLLYKSQIICEYMPTRCGCQCQGKVMCNNPATSAFGWPQSLQLYIWPDAPAFSCLAATVPGCGKVSLAPAKRSGAMCSFLHVDVMTTVPALREAIPHSYRGGAARHDLRHSCCSLRPPTDARTLSRSRLQPPKPSTSVAVHGLSIG